MRIPFIPKRIQIHQNQFDFVQDYKGGGFVLIICSFFWLATFLLPYIFPASVVERFYTFGGLSIPLLLLIGIKLFQLQPRPNQLTSLVGFASAITGCCFPILLIIKSLQPVLLLPVLLIIVASHLLILCWVYLDYIYFLLVAVGISLSMLFIYTIPFTYTHFIGLIWGIVTLLAGIYIHIHSKTPLKNYELIII